MSEEYLPLPRTEQRQHTWSTRIKKFGAFAAANLTFAVGGLVAPKVDPAPDYVAPYMQILHEDEVCPPESQFGVVNFSGAGKEDVAVYAASVTKKILGEQYDECEAALRYGTNYNQFLDAHVLAEFIEENHFTTIIIFASSFGGIAAVDTVAKYKELYPDSGVNFVIAFMSSPAGPESLQPLSWLGAQFHAAIPVGAPTVWLETFLSTMSQGNKLPTDPTVMHDVSANAKATPPTLLHEQTARILQGMAKLPDDGTIFTVYIGDNNDEVVKNQQAPNDIALRMGRAVDIIITMQYKDGMLNWHAALWWDEYIDDNRQAILDTMQAAQERFGFSAKKPTPRSREGLSINGGNRPI